MANLNSVFDKIRDVMTFEHETRSTDMFGWNRTHSQFKVHGIVSLNIRYTINSDISIYYEDLECWNGSIVIHESGHVERHDSVFNTVNNALDEIEKLINEES